MFDRFICIKTSFPKFFSSTLIATIGLISNLVLVQSVYAAESVSSSLAIPVENIDSVSPAPGSIDIDPDNTTLILNYPTTADYEWTYKSALSIHNLETGEQVFEIDPDKTHSQQGLKSFTLKLDKGVLESGSRYGVTVDYRFAVVNKAPWKSGEITEGLWTFSTTNPVPKAAPVELISQVAPLTPAVDNILGVYPVSGSTNIDPANTTLVLQFADIADYEWTHNSALMIHNLDTGKEVFTLDPDKTHAQQKLTSLTIPLGAGILESGSRYGVTVDYRFAIVNKAPWKSGEIKQGQWIFKTSGVSAVEQARIKAEQEAQAEKERLEEEARVKAEQEAQAEQERLAEEARIKAEQEAQAEKDRLAEEARIKAEQEVQSQAQIPVALTPEVANIVGVYPVPGSTNVDPINTSLVLNYPEIADYEWTHENSLTVHNLDTGEPVFTLDPTKDHPQQKLKSLTINLDEGLLKSGSRYGVTVDYAFAIVNKAPWKSGAIAEGQWTFTTSGSATTETPNASFSFFENQMLWTTKIDSADRHLNSANIISFLKGRDDGLNGPLSRMQIDTSLQVVEADNTTPRFPYDESAQLVYGTTYGAPACDNLINVPLPPSGRLEGGAANGDYSCAINKGEDCHLLVHDTANKILYEAFHASKITVDGEERFAAICNATWDLEHAYGENLRGANCTSADAAGLPITPLLVTADEIAAGEIQHALRFILRNDNMRRGLRVLPASHSGGPRSDNPDSPIYGMRFRLRADYPIDSLGESGRVIAKAMQSYGLIIVDGGNVPLTFMADTYSTAKWDDFSDYAPSMFNDVLSIADFEVIQNADPVPSTQSCESGVELSTKLEALIKNDSGPTPEVDSDGDGIADDVDTFPNNASESKDSDGDGVGDNADVFPNDASETQDSDGDGVGDNADSSPNGSGEYGGTDPSTANRDPIATGLPQNPIVFVSQLPTNTDFARVLSTFANHLPNPDNAGRGGDLYIRYQDGSLKNLTRLAGFGDAGEDQRENSISVRDPAVHWSGNKVIFSMVVGAPRRFARPEYYWQMYEVTGLGKNDTPVITKVENQPENYNNVGPVYGSDDRIIYASDMPLNGQRHLYPQHDEYESVATTTGLFSLDPVSGDFFRMVDSPSGSFDPLVARDGRVIMTNWDHLKRDQQATADRKDEKLHRPPVSGTFNYSDESATAKILKGDRTEYFPEPEARSLPEGSHFIGQNMNTFLPWQVEQDGTEMEMLNHVGRHELFGYLEKRVNNDPSIIGQAAPRGSNKQKIENFLQMIEDPTNPGIFYGVDAPEFQTQGSGQIIRINGHASLNGNEMQINYVTSRNSNSYEVDLSKSYGNQNTGHYRDPLPLSNGQLIAVHTDEPGILVDLNDAVHSHDMNYNYRLKYLTKGDDGLWKATNLLTSGLTRTINYYNPDDMVEYVDAEMWEVQPVEVVARPRPYPRTLNLPEPETAVFAEEDVSLDAVKAYLEANDLALVISRNLTRRDENDTQQPFNLCVADANNPCNENSTKTLGDDGRVYDVSHLQFFQADRIRGIGGTVKPKPGRRVLAMPMHDSTAFNPINTDGPEGSVKIAPDGSTAALVPAGRAMSWQLTNEGGDSIVAERFWVSFQPGEVRVCAVCHGLNESDQAGGELPTNKPEALRSMLTHIKGLMGTSNTDGGSNPDTDEHVDSDDDGVEDDLDAFPNDASETQDSDGDGVGDNADAFPNDASETLDSDGDGVGDNADAFPNDASETQDSDADGVGDNADAFPNDASETQDSDGDGVGDNADAFPNDASETQDSDGDGIGDNAEAASNGGSVSFVTQQLSDKNYTEGPAVADINKDGHKDIVAGQVIFLGPTYQDKIFLNTSRLAFYNGFAVRFTSFVDDVNNDGWPDVISLGLPGEKAFWYKNPGAFAANAVVAGSSSDTVMTWQTFDITPFVGNEAPAYTDLNGDGVNELVFMTPGKLVYARKGSDPEALWQLHDIGFNQHFATYVHGLGVGDLNGDGRPDIIEKSGIWIQQGSVSAPQWQREYYDFALGSKGGAQMLIYDVNGDSIKDIVTSHNGHGYGLSWFEQVQTSGGRNFVRHEILASNGVGDDNFSQLHALSAGDFNGDGTNDFVTGKRFKPHFDIDPGTDDPAVTYLFITKPNSADEKFEVIKIDDNSGVGVDLFTGDINGDGKRDIVTANKKGLFIHTQQ